MIVEDCSMCGICDNCKSGHPELCRNMYSIEGQPGMGQYMSVRFNSLVKFDGLDFVSACLTEPLAVSLTAVLNADIPLGGSVVVLGNGPLGLMSARLARLRGAGFVAITGLPADKRARTREVGGRGEAGLRHGHRVREGERGGHDQDAVPERRGSGHRELAAGKHGRRVQGHPLRRHHHVLRAPFRREEHDHLDVNDLIFRKICLVPTFAEPAINFPVANKLLRDGLVDARILITHTFGFSDAKKTLEGIVDGSSPVIKAVMLPNG